MGIEWFRDLVICIWGFLAIVFTIILSVLIFMLYKKTQKVMNSVDAICAKGNTILDEVGNTTSNLKGIINDIREEMMSPMVQVMAVIQSIRQVAGIFSQFKKKGEETEDG